MIPLGWILVILAANLAAPILWVALFNFIGLKRMLERLGDLENDSETLRNKARSIQTQISKKMPTKSEDEIDQRINDEISGLMRSPTGGNGLQVPSKGGIMK